MAEELTGFQRNAMLEHAGRIGAILASRWPAVADGGMEGEGSVTLVNGPDHCYIPRDGVEAIGEEITAVVAEIIQSWLDAGSEREVTGEQLGDPILEHLRGWCLPEEVREVR